jgi:gamma-glutamyltranspeptidase/glutathione hydrolase
VTLADLAAPAAALARSGVEINAQQGFISKILEGILLHTPEAAALFAPEGRALRPGDTFAWPDLGDALERLAAEGDAPFYSGDVAEAIVSVLEVRGGVLTREDLGGYGAVAREPVRAAFRGRTVLTNPPPNAGGVLIAAALALLDARTVDAVALIDVMETVQSARTRDFMTGLDEPGFAERFLASRLGSTTHVSVVDGEGRACAVTMTNGEGCGIVVPGTGVHPNNIMGEEDLNPFGFHAFPPRRRMPSMMAPTVVVGDNGVELVLGSAGSNRIRSAIVQVIAGVIDRGLDARAAVDAPRLHFEDGVVFTEPGVDVEALHAAGRDVREFDSPNLFFGGVQAVERDPASGALSGAGDPRRGGAAVAA